MALVLKPMMRDCVSHSLAATRFAVELQVIQHAEKAWQKPTRPFQTKVRRSRFRLSFSLSPKEKFRLPPSLSKPFLFISSLYYLSLIHI